MFVFISLAASEASPASTFVLPPVAAVSLKAPRRYGPSPLGLRATAFSRALTEWASTRWPVWVVRRCRKPTLRMAPFLRSASSSSSNATSNASRNSSRGNVAPLAGCPLFRVFCQWFRNAPAHVRYVSITTSWPDVLPSACRVATCTSRETPPPGSEIPRRTHLRPSVCTRGPCAPLVGVW